MQAPREAACPPAGASIRRFHGTGGQHSWPTPEGTAFCESHHWPPHSRRAGKACWPEGVSGRSVGQLWAACGSARDTQLLWLVCTWAASPKPVRCVSVHLQDSEKLLLLKDAIEPRRSTQSWWWPRLSSRTRLRPEPGPRHGLGVTAGPPPKRDLVRPPCLSEPPLSYFKSWVTQHSCFLHGLHQEHNERSLKQRQ